MRRFPYNCKCGDMLCPYPCIALFVFLFVVFFALGTYFLT